jgi:tellurite methyltransferase
MGEDKFVSRSQTGPGTKTLSAKWDQRYLCSDRFPPPVPVLSQNLHLLPSRGRALDLACGLGANALLLAEQGLEVVAWDLSPVAIERLRREAESRGLD